MHSSSLPASGARPRASSTVPASVGDALLQPEGADHLEVRRGAIHRIEGRLQRGRGRSRRAVRATWQVVQASLGEVQTAGDTDPFASLKLSSGYVRRMATTQLES